MRRLQWLASALMLVAAGLLPLTSPAAAQKTVRLAYVEWSSEIASTNLVKAVLQEAMGYSCRIIPMSVGNMWQAVATGEVDAMVSAWLPSTHNRYYAMVESRVENLGPNLEGTRIGLVIPDVSVGRQTAGSGMRNRPYIPIVSIPEMRDHADQFDRHIIGIDPGAGIMQKTREAMQAYDLDAFRLIEGSESTMIAELSYAIRTQQWIVVTGWQPHWMFGRWKLKFLDDPQSIYGGREHINTIVRPGLEKDMPEVYRFLDNFHWTPEEMSQLMLWIREEQGLFPYDQALRWMRANPKRVRSWLPNPHQ